jgi:nicotinamidase-related amidase
MLFIENSVLVIVDVQGKLAQLMHGKERLFANLALMVKGAQILEIPILWNEQNPQGLGPTIPELAELLSNQQPLPKMTFSCCGNAEFMKRLHQLDRKQVLLVGIEAHVCVFQTAAELLATGYEVHLISDAVSSRTQGNLQVGIERMKSLGAVISSTEMALFELLRTAADSKFRDISRLVK